MPTPRAVLAGLLLALPLSGCVERRFILRTEPEGARVTVNGIYAGTSPVDLPFDHYGRVRVEVEPYDADGNRFAEWRGIVTSHDLAAPWYEWFPLDFFSDNLVPWMVVDLHELTLRLEPAPDPERVTDREIEGLKAEAGELRIRAGRKRVEAEAEAPPPAPAPEGKGK